MLDSQTPQQRSVALLRWLPPLTRIAESARGGAGSVGERLQKYSSFAGFLPNEEYTAAIHDFAEPNLPDQQLSAQAAKEFHIARRDLCKAASSSTR